MAVPLGSGAAAAAARRTAAHADLLRSRASALAGAAQLASWQSVAAAAFRRDVAELAASMRRAADSVERAADLLDGHARRVRDVEHELSFGSVLGAILDLVP